MRKIALQIRLMAVPMILLFAVSEVSGQRKTLIKQNGVALTYEVEKIGSCAAVFQVSENGRLVSQARPNSIQVVRYTFYLANENSKPVRFSSNIAGTVNPQSRYSGVASRCPISDINVNFNISRAVMVPNSEFSHIMVALFDADKSPAIPRWNLYGFSVDK